MEHILSQARAKAEEAEVFMASVEETSIRFEANHLKHIETKQSTSVALRIIKDGKIGYAIATGLSDGAHLVNDAVETARLGMPAEFELPILTPYPHVDIFDADVESVPVEKMVELGEELIATVREHTPDLMCDAGATRSTASVSIINSRGGQASYRKSSFSLGIEGTLIRGTDMLFVGESKSSCRPLLEARPVADVVLRQLELAINQAAAPTKQLPVVFTPDGVGSALILPLVVAFNGKTVQEGASPIGNKLGQTVFDEKLVLWDDATIAYRPSSRPFDDEGIPSQRTPLIQKGVVTSFLYDLQTAAMARTRSTGNGSRGRGTLPAPAPSAFVIVPGKTPFEEMVQDMKEGLVIEQLMGAEQGNILGGDFSGNVLLGYKVEDGKITGRVKNTMVSGNVYHMLKQIAAIGKDAKWVSGFLQTPALYFSSVSVASK